MIWSTKTTKPTKTDVRNLLSHWMPSECHGVTDEDAVTIIEIRIKAEIKGRESAIMRLKKELAIIEDSK